MFKRTILAQAIIVASVSNLAHAQIEEVIVTATKQSASTQDIPIAVTALDEESLTQMGVSNFDDYIIQLPGVTSGGSGPGQSTIYIRGIASTTPALTTSGVAGLSPNVALYLDEQSLAQPGRNLDVYAADLARIEVLKGPQGTLYGASSQAGTIRLITNKPDPSGFSANIKLGAAITKGGEDSNNIEGMVNVPVSDNFTVRAVGYVDNQGGYIDNVAGTVDASSAGRFRTAKTIRSNGIPVGTRAGGQSTEDLSAVNFLSANNNANIEDDFNDAKYQGYRLSALWDINDDWSLLVGAASQTLDVDGVFFVDPDLGDLEVQRYSDETLEDSFDNYNWTLEGRLGALSMLYTGAYTERETDQLVDYVDYLAVGEYLPGYICDHSVAYNGTDNYPADTAPAGTCQAPYAYVPSETETEIQSHEIRFSTDQSASLRATFGAYYSSLELREVNSFTYPGSDLSARADGSIGFDPRFSQPGSSVKYTGAWASDTTFRNDILRTDDQKAVFGELSYDINEEFSATVGARWYDVEVDLKGTAGSTNLDTLFSGTNDTADADGVIGKVTLAWTPDDDSMYYFTWSEGYRAGLLNRPGGRSNPAGTYTVPVSLDTDEVTNVELGWKTDLLDGSLRFNGSIFMTEIERLQIAIFDASIVNLFFSDNAGDAEVKGIEGDFIWQPPSAEGLSISGGFSVLDTEVTEVLIPNFTDVVEGDSLAFAPELQANLQARYEWQLDSGITAHVMPHVSYSDEVYTDIITINRIQLDSWAMWGITAGLTTDDWSAELYVDNITDERAEVSGSYNYDQERITVSRPLTSGVRFSYNF